MPITIIVEDGTIVPNANSYTDIATVREYASNRGVSLSVDDEVVKSQMIKAVDYLESKRDLYQGNKTDSSQSLQFPRDNVVIDGFGITSDEIPSILKNAQSQLVIELNNNVDISPSFSGQRKNEVKTGPVTVKFQEGSSPSFVSLSSVENLLDPLYKNHFALSSVRV